MTPQQGLEPTNRQDLAELLRPWPGERVGWAVATTYTLDLRTLTAALLALLGGSDEESDSAEGGAFRALIGMGKRVRVYRDTAGLTPHTENRSVLRMCGLYDSVTTAVKLENGRFHPKVWVVKYVVVRRPSATGAKSSVLDRYRLICSSRNLTESGAWELMAVFDGRIARHQEGAVKGADVSAFLHAITRRDASKPAWMETALKEIAKATFPVPGRQGIQRADFLWQWPGESSLGEYIPKGSKALLVAPFISERFVARLPFADVTVVSRHDTLAGCWPEGTTRAGLRLQEVNGEDLDLNGRTMSLHAKLLACEVRDAQKDVRRTDMFIGSANGTAAAWSAADSSGTVAKRQPVNCEAVVRLVTCASLSTLGEGLAWLVSAFDPPGVPPDNELAERLDSCLRIVANLALLGTLRKGAAGGASQTLTLRAVDRRHLRKAMADLTQAGVTARASLFTRPGEWFDLTALESTIGQIIQIDDPGDVSRFLTVSLETENGNQKRFTLEFELKGRDWLASRERAVVQSAFPPTALLAMLREIIKGSPEPVRHSQRPEPPGLLPPPNRPELHDPTVTLEDLLGCIGDREKLGAIERLMNTAAPVDPSSPNEFEAFRQTWLAFSAVLGPQGQEVRSR